MPGHDLAMARILTLIGLLLLVATVVGSWALDRGWLELPMTELVSRYQLPDSQLRGCGRRAGALRGSRQRPAGGPAACLVPEPAQLGSAVCTT
jgi:hypothetical protein